MWVLDSFFKPPERVFRSRNKILSSLTASRERKTSSENSAL